MKRIRELLTEFREQEIKLILNGNDLEIISYKNRLNADQIQKIKSSKQEIIQYLKSIDQKESQETIAIPNVNSNEESYPTSNAQFRIWLASQLEEGSIGYNMPNTIILDGTYDLRYFQKAIYAVIERHEILRTVFNLNEQGALRQYILTLDALDFFIDAKDFRMEAQPEVAARAYVSTDAYKAFDLAKGPLLRVSLLQLSAENFILYYNMHHIISDGWSMDVLSRDIMSYYEAYATGNPLTISPLRIQYKDYAVWQLNQLNSAIYQSHKEYWLAQFKKETVPIDLPTEKRRPQLKGYNGRSIGRLLSLDLTTKLRSFTSAREGSLFLGLLTIWKILLYRYTGETDLVIGNPVSGRNHADLEPQIGFYVNTIALRNQINPQDRFVNFFDQVKENTLAAFAHQTYPFDKLLEDLSLQRDLSRSPLFDILINYHGISEVDTSFAADQTLCDLGAVKVMFDLELDLREVLNGVNIILSYNEDIYGKELVEKLLVHYEALIKAFLAQPDESIAEVNFLSEAERKELLEEVNTTQVDYPTNKTIVDLFEDQVNANPNGIALVFEDRKLSYKALNDRANQLAFYLVQQGIAKERLIPICMERSIEMIVGILGVLKAGAAYVPIDPDFPPERIDYLLKDTAAKTVLTSKAAKAFMHPSENVLRIDLAEDWRGFENEAAKNFKHTISSNQLAYIIYTSGSTGMPKGVMIEHRSVLNHILYHTTRFGVNPTDHILLFSNFIFDASIEQIFLALTNGSSLYLTTKAFLLNANLLKKFLIENEITHLDSTPSFLVNIPFDNYKSLRRVISGGEYCPSHLAELWGSKYEFYNAYGPTETTITSIGYKFEAAATAHYNTIPIGRPIANTKVYVLDKYLNITPIGVTGELCIAGAGLARGYLNQSNLTAEKFIVNPFNPTERMYLTGDIVRWLPDRQLEFIGRKDDQVKIRGYRIELGEIESALDQIAEIKQSVVVARKYATGSKQLVAYITNEKEIDDRSIQELLRKKLPVYMVPKIYVFLAEIPFTASGKIDRKALPLPSSDATKNYVAPSNEIEIQLVKIWEELLGKERIGIRDNFFELGGDSLKLMQLNTAIQNQFKIEIPIRDFFLLPVIKELAQVIEIAGQMPKKERKNTITI